MQWSAPVVSLTILQDAALLPHGLDAIVPCLLCPWAPQAVGSNLLSVWGKKKQKKKNKTTLTWLLKVLVGHFPGISDFQQTGFHSPQIHLGAITLWVVHGALAPAVIVPAHKLALLITADVAESRLHKPGPQVLWQYGLKTYSEDKNKTKTWECHTDEWRGSSKYFSYCRKRCLWQLFVRSVNHWKAELISSVCCLFWHVDICLASHAICQDSLKVIFLPRSSATFVLNHYCLGFTSELCKHARQKKKEEEWLKLNLFWHSRAAVISLPENRHCDNSIRKLGEFNYGWPTLQMNLVFGALNQNGADRIEVVIVTASERARPCFGHLKGEKQAR